MTEVEQDFVDESEVEGGTVILKEGLILKELVNGESTEFSLDASKNNCEESDVEKRVDTYYDFKDLEPHINLECIQTDMSENDAKTPFDIIRGKMTNVTEDGGVRKFVKRPGIGGKIPERAVIYVHYNSYLEMEEVPFDTSYLRAHKPLRFQLGTGSMYPGFEIAVSTMEKGELSQFLVEPSYGFGKMGVPPRIPPNAIILLEIEMMNFVDCGDAMPGIQEEDKRKFATAYKSAKSYHALGNDYFAHKNIGAAAENYRKAEQLLMSCYMNNEEEEQNQKKLLMKVYVNLSICYNDPKLRMPERVCHVAKAAMCLAPTETRNNSKLQYNWGKALMALNNFKAAGEHLRKALSIQPNNSDICQQLKLLETKKKEYYEQEKICYKKALRLDKSPKGDINDEIERVTKDFEIMMRENLEEFKDGLQNRMQLPKGLTKEERDLSRDIAENMGLSYQEETVGNSITISILKNHIKPLTENV